MSADNTELGRFDLVGIPAAPRGLPQIEVTFDIDANGIVHVHAKDKGTGKEQSIQITAPDKLSEEEIEKMVKESEKFAEDDKKKKESVELKNKADTAVYATEKSLKDFGDKVSDDEKKKIQEKLDILKEILKKSDPSKDDVEKALDELTQASHKLAEQIYKASAADKDQAAGGETPQSPEDQAKKPEGEKVVDAEYKEEDNSKK